MDRSNFREWYEDFKTYFHVATVIIVLAAIYFIISFDWSPRDRPALNPVRSAENVFYQGSQHDLVGIVANITVVISMIYDNGTTWQQLGVIAANSSSESNAPGN